MAKDSYGNLSVSLEGGKPSYAAGIEILAASMAANATDVFQIIGAAGKIIKIQRIQVSADATAAASVDMYLLKRTTANTGGTVSAVTGVAYDSVDLAPSATVQVYTANPSALGTGQIIRIDGYALPAASTTGYPFNPIVWDFGTRNAKCPTLRGVGESLVFNWGGQAINTGLDIWIDIEWTEEIASFT
jgi:hypothetical protein